MAQAVSKHQNSTLYSGEKNGKRQNPEQVCAKVVLFLSDKHTNGCLHNGAIEEAMTKFPYKRAQIQRIWYKNRNAVLDPTNNTLDLKRKHSDKVGRPKKYSAEDFAGIKEIPLLMRTCLGTVSNHIDIPLTNLWQYWKLCEVIKSTVHM